MKSAYSQRGLSSISILIVMMVAAFFLICALKLIPIYIEGASVASSVSSAFEDKEFDNLTVKQMRTKLGKYFEINRIQGISARDIKIKRVKGTTYIDASYEQREQLLFNIDVVVKFDDLKYEFTSSQ
jgi:hypothetical protein